MTYYPRISFEDVRKGDVLRYYSHGFSHQATAEQQISPDTWDTAGGDTIMYQGGTRVFFLVSREPTPDTLEPKNIGSVVEDADGLRYVRTASDVSIYRWVFGGGSYEWADLQQPIKILHEGWVDNTV